MIWAMWGISIPFLAHQWLGVKVSAIDKDWETIIQQPTEPTKDEKGRKGTVCDPPEEQLWGHF